MTNGLDKRIAGLEYSAKHTDDTLLTERGQTVTDAELRALAADVTSVAPTRRAGRRAIQASTISDAELYRLIEPGIEALRKSAHEQS